MKLLAGVRSREAAAARANSKKQPSYNRYEVQEKDFWKERGAGMWNLCLPVTYFDFH